jgi:hypothetical protein
MIRAGAAAARRGVGAAVQLHAIRRASSHLVAGLPKFVKIVEVGPRDGLQNEPKVCCVCVCAALTCLHARARVSSPVLRACCRRVAPCFAQAAAGV